MITDFDVPDFSNVLASKDFGKIRWHCDPRMDYNKVL